MKYTSIVASWILSIGFAFSVPVAARGLEPGPGGDSPSEQMEYRTPEAKKLIERIEGGDAEGARKELKKLLRRKSVSPELWMIQGLLLANDGDYDAALAAFEKAKKGTPEDLPVLLMQARIHEDRAELGPGGARKGGMVSYKPSALKEVDREKFVATEKRSAAECYRKALQLHPAARPYQIKYTALLLGSGDAKGAFATASGYAQQSPKEDGLWLQAAKSAVALEAWPEARAAAERCVALRGSLAEACHIMAQLNEREGKTETAKEWGRQARFYAFVPSFLPVDYTPENFARIEALLVDWEKVSEDQHKEVSARAVAAIDALIAEKSETSSRLLGIIAWGHNWHGEVEDRIYAELEARKYEAVLVALFDRANSYCTVGSAAPALARMKSEVAFPLIVERLPMDQNMFSMQLPESLAIYGRPEAIAPLGKALQEAIQANARAGKSVDVMMAGMGDRFFIERCIWALATFKTPEARGFLEAAAKQKDFEVEAVAAIFKQSGEPAYFQRLLKLLKADPDAAEWIAKRYLHAGLPEGVAVDEIAQAHAAAKKTAQEKRKK